MRSVIIVSMRDAVMHVVAMSSSQCVNRGRACIVVNRDNYSQYYMCVHVWQVTVLYSFQGTGCAKKKKDILNIYVKSQIINIYF